MKAKLQKDNLKDFSGHAALYKLTPPLVESTYDGKQKKHTYVVVSAVVAMFSGPETYIFPANAKGQVKRYTELDGSFKGGLNHTEALRGAGYSIER